MEGRYDKRIKPQKEREIYRPGSGPLKRTDPVESKNYIHKNNCYEKIDQSRSDKEIFETDKDSYDSIPYSEFDQNDKNFDRDRKKTRKPDVSIYVPKQRPKADISNQSSSTFGSSGSVSQPAYASSGKTFSRDRFMGRESECNNLQTQYDGSSQQNKLYIESKQFSRGNKNDTDYNWKDSIKDNSDMKRQEPSRDAYDTHSSRKGNCKGNSFNDEKNSQYNYDHKNSNNYNRYGNEPRNERSGDKNRMGKSLSRRNSSNSLVIPDVFSSWPPRLQRQYLEGKGIKPEDIDKYLENKPSFSGNSNRDNRYSQTLPSKNNRSRFKTTNKENTGNRNNRTFQKQPKYFNENPQEEKLDVFEERKTDDVSDLCGHMEKNWDTDVTQEVLDKNDVPKKGDSIAGKTSPDNISEKNDSNKTSIDDVNEEFNWAEEVEREQQYAERNLSETDDFQKNDESNYEDKKKDRKKRRRREFRKKRGFSYERKPPPKSRNQSEGENYERRNVDDRRQINRPENESNSLFKERNSESNNTDGYLSWRRNKNPSPTRGRLGIMGRTQRYDNKFEAFRTNPNEQDRLNNKTKINNKINDLPSAVRDQMNSTGNKDNVAGIIKIPQPQTGLLSASSDVKCSPPVFPAPQQYQVHPNKSVKQLYNPTNPKQPIIVSNQSSRAAVAAAQPMPPPYSVPSTTEHSNPMYIAPYVDPNISSVIPSPFVTDQYIMSRPAWYDVYSDSFRSSHNAYLLLDISRADTELQGLLVPGTVMRAWNRISALRGFLQEALKTLLTTDLKFCETENVEQHMWKILFYNIIELLRKCISEDTVNSQQYKSLLFSVIDQGTDYFKNVIKLLERVFKMKIDDFLLAECPSTKGDRFLGLALIAAQKIFLCLGDLSRYKETSEELCNYASSRQWYMKAHQLNPRNGKPYNQLAILAVYGRKKFEAVYYYMRSLMASNPFFTARESLLALFDENRKKYEQIEKIRREQKEKKKQEKAKEKESVINGSMLRKEIWIRPDDGKRIHRTTSTSQECTEDSEDDELLKMSPAEVNKQFLLSFLHVHGKLFSKVGMETLQEAAIEMLNEFKVLLSHSPLPITTARLLQLLALNMFSIDNGQLKDPQLESGYHSAVQESALVISLQMFNLIVHRCIQLLKEQLSQMKNNFDQMAWKHPLIVDGDVQILLPAIKLWCDWLFCHSIVWNPPPSCQDYKISGCGDCWSRLATLVNILEELDYQEMLKKAGFKESILVMSNDKNDMIKIALEEDVTLSGFTPLMCNTQQSVYTHKHIEMELAQVCLRIHRILFFGTMFLCGIDPPVLKLHKTQAGTNEYISVVEEVITPKDQSDNENMDDHWSESENEKKDEEEEQECSYKENAEGIDEKSLLYRKKELERIHLKREKYIRDKKETLNKEMAAFSIEMEIKPHYLVPDTNCFIDCLPEIEKIVKAVSVHNRPLYLLMVPVIVLNELEGIAKGARKDEKVSENARYALTFLMNRSSCANIKCVTTRGSVLTSTRFTSEEDYSKVEKNDDKILTTCLNLCKHNVSCNNNIEQPKKIYREVVLLTEDRNLRVKALSSNMPVQTVSDFIRWAGLN